MFERFTERARKVVVLAQEEARHFNHNYIGTEHLLLGLLREDEGVAAQALSSLNVALDEVREQVESIVGYGEEGTGAQAPFTPRSKKVLELALREALQLGHNYIGTEHILLGLIREGEGVAAAVLTNLSVDLEQVQERVEESVRRGKATIALGELPYTSRAKKVLEFAMAEARELNHQYVGTEHLLLGLLREEKGIAAEVLNQLGVTLEDARRETLKLLGSDPNASAGGGGGASASSGGGTGGAPKGDKKSKTPALDHFCRDLTELARQG